MTWRSWDLVRLFGWLRRAALLWKLAWLIFASPVVLAKVLLFDVPGGIPLALLEWFARRRGIVFDPSGAVLHDRPGGDGTVYITPAVRRRIVREALESVTMDGQTEPRLIHALRRAYGPDPKDWLEVVTKGPVFL